MIRAKLSYRFAGLLYRVLPSGAASPIVRFLGLKMPVTPVTLAGGLLTSSLELIKSWEQISVNATGAGLFGEDNSRPPMVVSEVLCGLYCLACEMLSQDDFARPPEVFRVYTSLTHQELGNLLSEMDISIPIDRILDETTKLYLGNEPSADLLASRYPDYVLPSDMAKAAPTASWGSTFALKLQIRVFAALGIDKSDIRFYPLSLHMLYLLNELVAFYKGIRPAFIDPS